MKKIRHKKTIKTQRKGKLQADKFILTTSIIAGILIVFLGIIFITQSFFKINAQSTNSLKQIVIHHFKPVCGPPKSKSARCNAQVVTDDSLKPLASSQPPTTALTPLQLHLAYNLPCTPGGQVQGQCPTPTTFGPIIAVIDAYSTPTLESDLNTFRAAFGLPLCTQSNGCLQIVDENGGTNLPTTVDQNWSLEADLDVQTIHAMCQTCKILFIEANSPSMLDLATAVTTAAKMGAKAISNSYGAAEFSGENYYDSYYNHPGIAVTASSGDSGFGTNYPASSTDVIGVGGTTLQVTSNGYYVSESVWNGSGSGCSAYETALSNQLGVSDWASTGCSSNKAVADISADADPNTGVPVYDSTPYSSQTGWWQVGGTSLSSPIVASEFVLANNTSVTSGTQIGSLLYQNYNATNFHDILTGSNGTCGTIMCNGATGYDGPSGLGSLNGLGGFGGTPQPPITTTSIPQHAWINTNTYIFPYNFDGSPGGNYINSIAYYSPIGIAVVGNQVWAATIQFGGAIARLDFNGAQAAPMLTGNGISEPRAIAVVGNQVWVINENNSSTPTSFSISRFNSDGTSAGSPLTGNGMCDPGSIAVVGNQVWVGNTNYSTSCGTQTIGTISRFNFDGTSAGKMISGNGLDNVAGIAVVGTKVWVANYFTNSISLFNFDGTPAGKPKKVKGKLVYPQITGNDLNHPGPVSVVGNQVWVGNSYSDYATPTYHISRFNPDGTTASTPIDIGNEIPYSIAIIPSH